MFHNGGPFVAVSIFCNYRVMHNAECDIVNEIVWDSLSVEEGESQHLERCGLALRNKPSVYTGWGPPSQTHLSGDVCSAV